MQNNLRLLIRRMVLKPLHSPPIVNGCFLALVRLCKVDCIQGCRTFILFVLLDYGFLKLGLLAQVIIFDNYFESSRDFSNKGVPRTRCRMERRIPFRSCPEGRLKFYRSSLCIQIFLGKILLCQLLKFLISAGFTYSSQSCVQFFVQIGIDGGLFPSPGETFIVTFCFSEVLS